MNLFELSPRELTNSAFWTWVLSGLMLPSFDSRRAIADALLSELGVPIPDSVSLLKSEYALPDGRRIDVYLEGKTGDQSFVFFIENKVQYDGGIDRQVKGYIDALSAPGVKLYPAVFSLEPGTGRIISSSPLFSELDRPKAFDLDGMIRLLARINLHEEGIPAEFLRYLTLRRDQRQRVKTAMVRGGADPEAWLDVARKNGVEDLFIAYVDCIVSYEAVSGTKIEYGKSRAVYVFGKSKRPLISLHPIASKTNRGIKVGYNDVNWEYHFGHQFPRSVLPLGFEDLPDPKGQPNWHFGFLASAEAVASFVGALGEL